MLKLLIGRYGFLFGNLTWWLFNNNFRLHIIFELLLNRPNFVFDADSLTKSASGKAVLYIPTAQFTIISNTILSWTGSAS